jgi:general secretion pathway protein D
MYEAYKAFLSALEANNLTVVKRGKFFRIVPKVKARTAGAAILGPGRRAPLNDNMVTQLIPIQHVIADEVKELIQNFATDGADITVYNPTNTLIITETGTNIARLRKLIRQVDQPTGAVRIWVRPVEYAESADIQKHIETIFGKGARGGKKSSSRRPARTTGRRGKNVASPATGSALGDAGGELSVSADERTNQLIIITDRSTYLRVDKLIRKLDVPIPGEGQIHIHHLQNADAKDVQSTLQALAGSGSSRGRKRSSKRSKGKKGKGAGTAVLGGEVKITAHEPTNSLVIEANLKDYLVLQRVIRQLDVRRKQVYLESVIMEITSDKSRDLGLSGYGGLTFDVGGETVPLIFGNTLGPDIQGLQDAFPGGFGAMLLGPLLDASLGSTGGGGTPSSISIPAFGFTLKALQSNSDVNILQTPHLLTTDNEEAVIEIGRKVPFNAGLGGGLGGLGALGGLAGLGGIGSSLAGLGSLSSTLGAFSGLGSIQYADIKISLKIKPTVNESNFIRLEIEQQIDDFDGIDPATKAPNTSNRRVKNIVSVRDQQPVVIGGLMNDREIKGVSKIPILGDIPLLGALFRQQTTKIQRKNLLMIIIPHIIDDPSDLKRIHEQRMEEIRNFAEYVATRKKEYMGEINYKKKHGMLHEIHKVVEQAKKERYELEQQNFEDSDLDPVGPPNSHDLDYDPYQVEQRRDGAGSKDKKAKK